MPSVNLSSAHLRTEDLTKPQEVTDF